MHTLSEAGFKFRGDDLSEFEHRCTESSFFGASLPSMPDLYALYLFIEPFNAFLDEYV